MSNLVNTYILFRTADAFWAASVESVQRVHPALSVHRVPGTRQWFLGVAQSDGVLLSISDLGAWLNKRSCQGPVLQLHPQLGAIGLRVDEIVGAQALTSIDTALNANDAVMPGALARTVEYNGQSFRIVALSELVLSPAFLAIHQQPVQRADSSRVHSA